MAQNGPCPPHSYKVVSFPPWGLWNLTVWLRKAGTAEEVAFQPGKQCALRALCEDATPDPSAHCHEVSETALLLRHTPPLFPSMVRANYWLMLMMHVNLGSWGVCSGFWIPGSWKQQQLSAGWIHTCWGAWDQLWTVRLVLTSLEIYSCVYLFLNCTAIQTRVTGSRAREPAKCWSLTTRVQDSKTQVKVRGSGAHP